jgi:large subunit ribosomal protein L15
MQCHDLKSPRGSRKKRKTIGRGRGSGTGRTSGKGNKGQKSRSGRGVILNSEGGQMPLIRRLSKVGFNSHRPILNQIVILESLNTFNNGTVINKAVLKAAGLIKSINKPFKILAGGEIKKSLVFEKASISESAKKMILAAGGEIKKIKRIFNNKKKNLSK